MIKKSLWKKTMALLLAGSMGVAALSGCGASETTSSEASSSAAPATSVAASSEAASSEVSEPVEEGFDPKSISEGVKLTVAVPEHVRIADWDNNLVTLYVEENLGVELEFEVYPSADFLEKVNAMVMSGDDLPDIICNLNVGNYTTAWYEEEAIIDLAEYCNDPDMAANLHIASEDMGIDLVTASKNYDGTILWYPRISHSMQNQTMQKLWIYKPWLDDLGLEVPTTIEEFYEACKLVAEKDMNGNGDATDEYPILGFGFNNGGGWSDWFDALMAAFVPYSYDNNYYMIEDGEVSVAYTTDGWKEGVKYIKENFFDQGLITSEIFTLTEDQMKAAMVTEEPTLFSCVTWYGGSGAGTTTYEEGYVCIPGLTNAAGENGYSYYSAGNPASSAVITTDCENPEAAFLVLDLLGSRHVTLMNRYGEEGVHWMYWDDAVKAGKVNPSEYKATDGSDNILWWQNPEIDYWGGSDTVKGGWMAVGPFLRSYWLQTGSMAMKTVFNTEEEERLYGIKLNLTLADQICYDNRPEEVVGKLLLSGDEDAERKEIHATLKSYLAEMTTNFLLGEKDIDAEWDAYLAELEKIGLSRALELTQLGYDRTK